MNWRVAKSLLTLRGQVDAMAPNRDKSSDGTIGDTSHQARPSDHNPNSEGVVTAMDITHDPSHGVDAGALAELLRNSKDPRIKYVISNARIFSSTKQPWQWRPYNGANAHTKHVHVSVVGDNAQYDDTRPWPLEMISKVQPPLQVPGSKRCMNITATVFGGASDPNTSAYDEHIITDTELGVALPDRFKVRPLPKVRVFNAKTQASVLCDVVDVGPWNIDDPYWKTGDRPQAETGVDRKGRATNLAGIDLTPAAARAIGIPGKGKVDWEFADVSISKPDGGPMGTSVGDIIMVLEKVLPLLKAIQNQQTGTQVPENAPTQPTTPQAELEKILEIIKVFTGKDGIQPLDQVNGALGETIGTMLNGKKTAIGTIGALLTTLLTQAPQLSTALGGIIGLGAATPVAPVVLPIFLALTGWGVLGKLEKWTQTIAKR